jgi:DNA-directed RNA polymerase subunit RPC12/RpoP
MTTCPNCDGTTGADLLNGIGYLKLFGGAILNTVATRGATLTGQGSKEVWRCSDCKKAFATCPFCEGLTEADPTQIFSEIRCVHCRDSFVVK